MKIVEFLKKELRTVALTTAYFLFCFGIVFILKKLTLEEYHIELRGFSTAIVGALIVAKVVILIEKVPIGGAVRHLPTFADVLCRSFLYTLAVLVAAGIERSFHIRKDTGDLQSAVIALFQNPDYYHFWSTVLCVGLAFVAYNGFSVVRLHLGAGELTTLFFKTTRAELETAKRTSAEKGDVGSEAT